MPIIKPQLLVIFLFWSSFSYGLNFPLPGPGSGMVGEVKTTQVKPDESFSDVAIRFDVGYYEILEANPGINPDHPPVDAVLVVPTKYILPQELNSNTMVINLPEMRLYYQPTHEKKVYIFPVGIGKEDWGTPQGEMTIVQKTKDPSWVVPDSIYKFRQQIGDKIKRVVPPGPDNPLGKYALRLSQGAYLIHGTNVPEGVGRRTSAGCIRLYANDIEQLYNVVSVGTKVIIINKPYKAGWLDKKLYLEAHQPLFEQRLEMGDDMKLALDVVSDALRNHKIMVDWKKVSTIAKEHLAIPRLLT